MAWRGRWKEGRRCRRSIEHVPADVSAAAFWLVAAAIHPDAELTLRDVGVNPTRRAVIDLLRAMGADIDERPTSTASEDEADIGEPIADLVVRSSSLQAIDLAPADVAAAIDEIPVLCLAATRANGTTTIRGAGELRHKESDRIAGIVAGLTALGASVGVDGDDLDRPRRSHPAWRGDRQPRRPPPGDDVRGGRSERDRCDDHRAVGVGRGVLSGLLRRS